MQGEGGVAEWKEGGGRGGWCRGRRGVVQGEEGCGRYVNERGREWWSGEEGHSGEEGKGRGRKVLGDGE